MRYLLGAGAAREAVTAEGETALELVEGGDLDTVAALLGGAGPGVHRTKGDILTRRVSSASRRVLPDIIVLQDTKESVRRRGEPAWVRRESVQEGLGLVKKKTTSPAVAAVIQCTRVISSLQQQQQQQRQVSNNKPAAAKKKCVDEINLKLQLQPLPPTKCTEQTLHKSERRRI